jgi:hypothetical protein
VGAVPFRRSAEDVALKVLPEAFTDDPDRLARFEREAKVGHGERVELRGVGG